MVSGMWCEFRNILTTQFYRERLQREKRLYIGQDRMNREKGGKRLKDIAKASIRAGRSFQSEARLN